MASIHEVEDENNDIEIISGPASGMSESKSESPVMLSSERNGSNNGSDEDLEVSQILKDSSENQDAMFQSSVLETSTIVEVALNLEEAVPKHEKTSEVEVEVIKRDDDVNESKLHNPEAEEKETKIAAVKDEDDKDWTDGEESDDEDYEETLLERLVGLTEMFPKSLRTGVTKAAAGSLCAVKGSYQFARNASWIFFSSALILFAPLLFETERAQMLELEKQQQRQILLGPGAAVSGSPPPGGMGVMAPPPPR